MPQILLAVDLSYQVYRATASHQMLRSGRTFTGGLFGFMQQFATMVRETRATRVVICRDMKPYLRSRDYPEYKQLRKKRQDDDMLLAYNESMPLVLELLALTGLPVWGIEGFESDDLVAHCVNRYRHRFDRIYAASNDSDLFQLFWCDTFFVWRSSVLDVVSRKALYANTGLTPEEFMLSTALQGTHNDIAGIPRVGEKTAFTAVKTDPALMRKLRASHGDIIDRNLRLIKLPHPEFPRNAPLPGHTAEFEPRDLYRWCARFDIDVTAGMVAAFEQVQPR
jgi:5'-3' exonuclease